MKWGDEIPAQFDLSLAARCSARSASRSTPRRGSGTADVIGGDRCPIVDTWWQTETGAHHDQPAARRHRRQAGLGHERAARHRRRRRRRRRRTRWPTAAAATSCSPSRGRRCCAASGATRSATRTPTGRAGRHYYFAGDGAKKDEDGDIWLLGRVDDVMNVSGHRLSTTEIESALVSHPKVAEAAVVGATDETTGQAVVAFVILREGVERRRPDIVHELRNHVAPRDRPDRQAAPDHGRRRSCPRPARARSCAGCCGTSPRTARWAT